MTPSPHCVYHYLFNGDRTARKLSSGESIDTIGEHQTHWQHVDLQQPGLDQWLADSAGIETLVHQALSAEETRPRSFAAANGLLVVLRGVNTNPGQDAEDMVSIRLWIEKNRIISVRRRQLLSVSDIVQNIELNLGPRSSGEFLTILVENLANRIGDFVNRIEDDLGQAEDELETMHPSDLRAVLGSLRRQIAVVRRFLAPQRDALDRLNHIETDILHARDKQRLREESDRVSRYLEDLDLARERAVVLQEAFLSQLAQQQNSRMYVLSVVAAIFLPLTFVTGLLGMNVGGLPGIDNPQGFALASVVMLVATVGLIILFKWRKWI